VHKTFSRICPQIEILDASHFMKLLLREIGILLVGASITVPIVLSFIAGVQAQPTTPPAIAPTPRLTLTAEQEYTIREVVLNDVNVPKEKSASETVGDSVPDNVKLYPLPSEILEKVPQARSHKFFVKDDDTIILVSPSDRRIADVLKKKSSD
jgi:Protein of unknown function (DUF1236)